MRLLTLAILAAVNAQTHSQPKPSPYTLVADAGSTGTRMYLFHFEADAGGKEKLDISDLGKGPALSSFQDKPGDAVATVTQQIDKAKSIIPAHLWMGVPVMVFATAGMRLVDKAKAEAVYAGLTSGLLAANFPFDPSALVAKTISGREEGVYAFVAANYLSENIDADMKVKKLELMGVMDLGGSSTQIAVPPLVSRQGDALQASLGEAHMYVKSFLSLGMERMRKLTYEKTVHEAHWAQRLSAKVPNPCAFNGFDGSGELWRGTGDAVQCQHTITAVLTNETERCKRKKKGGQDCLPMPRHLKSGHHHNKSPFKQAKGAAPHRFFMISGYVFVADFARWWLEHPGVLAKPPENMQQDERELLSALATSKTFSNPTLRELRSAAAVLCSGPWTDVIAAASNSETRHKFTNEKKAADRCFELNYIICLLSVGYGFPEDDRPFQYVDSIGGRDVEWSLGAFLLSRSKSGLDIEQGSNDTSATSMALQGDTWIIVLAGILLLAGIAFVVRRRSSKGQPCIDLPCIELGAGQAKQS